MLTHIFIPLMLCCMANQLGAVDNNEYLMQLSPHQVRQAFDNVINEDYIKELAKEFASRAAAQFVKEIKNHKNVLLSQMNRSLGSDVKKPAPVKKIKNTKTVKANTKKAKEVPTLDTKEEEEALKAELDDKEALKLLEDPSPDGDHLDSSVELTDTEKNKIPVIQLTKINGIYYRRLLGMI